ncbi:copine-3-like [Clavelina lepadiformis]|uniref:copine-3-like n=1 Tax=Clavelina lepadiformis TaxID=159417 RepID=UPI0040433365
MMVNPMMMRIELRFSCNNLLPADVMSPPDPIIVVKQRDNFGKFHEIGRTEKIKNTYNPTFSTPVEIDYCFEEIQCLKFAVYDIDNDSPALDDDDGLGKAILTLGQVVSTRELTSKLSKQNPSAKEPCTITISATEVTDINEMEFSVRAEGLDKKDLLGKSDPYMEIYRIEGDGKDTLVHKTEVIKNTLKPKWAPFSVRIQNLCQGDFDRAIKFKVFDYDSGGDHDLIGECEASLSFATGSEDTTLNLINPKKKAQKKNYKKSGKLTFVSCKLVKKFSFLDYVFGGCQINFTCGIDFTGSNGDPRQSSSLHYFGSTNPNEYAQAIQAVGYVIQDYDSDKLFPAFGFGAKIPPENEISHEFALNFNPQNPYCAGVGGLLEAYQNAIRTVKLWGPTNLSPIINHVARFAAEAQAKPEATNYFVLLLITDGVVTDMDETRRAIVAASQLPMSIIIIGVGNADFTAMEFLDGDTGALKDKEGRQAIRDIVQFVPFRKFKMVTSSTLSNHVLREVPKQVVDYFSMRKLQPGVATHLNHVSE